MASLQKIKHRISSINSTEKITKAMELIATAKFAKIKNDLDQVHSYYLSVRKIFYDLLRYSTPNIDVLLDESATLKYEKKRKLYIVFGSDLGLCGAFNTNMLKKINEVVTDEDIFITIGSKLLKMLQKRLNTHIIQTLTQTGDEPNYEIAKILAQKIYDVLQISDLSSISVIYTKYINAIDSEPVVREIYPITFLEEEKTEPMLDASSFEPNADEIIFNSFVMFFEASMYYAFYNSKLAEMSMRRTAMEQASDNALDLINDLKLEYNRNRQAKITQEITEIVGGASSE